MSSVFDLDQEFDETKIKDYTDDNLRSELSDGEVQVARKNCKKLFPFAMEKRLSIGDAKGRFERLQFLHYMVLKQRECKDNGFSVYDCIQNPSERYIDLYSKMIFDIRRKVSAPIRLATDGLRLIGPEQKANTQGSYEKQGWYDESIHLVLQHIDRLLLDLIEYSSSTGLNFIPSQPDLFLQEIKKFSKQSFSSVKMNNHWDELYLYLNFARCMYWEFDLLDSFHSVGDTMCNYFKKIDIGDENKYIRMLSEGSWSNYLDYNCFLLYDEDTESPEGGRIVESETDSDHDLISADNIDSYLRALQKYVDDHVDEITKRVFETETATKNDKKKIRTHFRYVSEFFRLEYDRNTYTANLSKVRLIAVFQISFLLSNQFGLAKKKKGTPKALSIKGKLKREKSTLSSTLSNHQGKEPRYFSQICGWVHCHMLFKAKNMYLVQIYQKTICEVLKLLCAKCSLGDLESSNSTAIRLIPSMEITQFRAEKILFKAVEILIPDIIGQEQIYECVDQLNARGLIFEDFFLGDEELLSKLGKYFWTLGTETVVNAIQQVINASNQEEIYEIPLNEAAKDLIHQHVLLLSVKYKADSEMYSFQSFDIYESNITCQLIKDP